MKLVWFLILQSSAILSLLACLVVRIRSGHASNAEEIIFSFAVFPVGGCLYYSLKSLKERILPEKLLTVKQKDHTDLLAITIIIALSVFVYWAARRSG